MAVVATLSKGYDLDYIWKQVDRAPAKDAASYYIQASESGGEPPGRWWGAGARALGVEPGQRIERKPYARRFGERRAPEGPQRGGHRMEAEKQLTSTSCCSRPSRMPPPSASASCGP